MQEIELLSKYLEFCTIRSNFDRSRSIDLTKTEFLYPITLMPLCKLIRENTGKVISPMDHGVSNYIRTILENTLDTTSQKSYVPAVLLPLNYKECEAILQRIYRLQDGDKGICGGENAFKYVIGELVDNIYQHSGFKTGLVMAQKYQDKGFVDLCFFDDGITIPMNFVEHGYEFNPTDAILEAIKGRSTKSKERGFGLSSSVKIFVDGLNGQILIVSGGGAVYLEKKQKYGYTLSAEQRLDGTLIGLRVPYPSPVIDIYKYIE